MNGGVRSCDVLVVGRGAAGCIASLRLAKAGADVVLIGREASATALSTGRIDLRGAMNEEALSNVLRELGEAHGLFQGPQGLREVVSNCGTLGRQTLSSVHDWSSESPAQSTAVMGLKGNADVDPVLVCSALAKARPELRCRPCRAELSLPSAINTGAGPGLTWEANAAVDVVSSFVRDLDEDEVVLPPLFSGPNHGRALSALERSSGRQVREPMTPLSNPGRRLQACLEDGAVQAGCTLWNERELCGLEMHRGSITMATLRSGLREVSVRPKAMLLATGNMVAGGLSVEGEEVVDPLGLFALEAIEGGTLSSSRMTRCLSIGVRNRQGRAALRDGTITDIVWVAGSAVPGCSYPLGKGLGQVMDDAWTKADLVREAL